MDVVQEELDIFKASANRMRWFISMAVLISVLILLHVYLEQFGFQQAQLSGIQANREFHRAEEVKKCYQDMIALKRNLKSQTDQKAIDDLGSCLPDKIPERLSRSIRAMPYEELVYEYSSREFDIKMTNNTIDNVQFPVRQIPVLGTEIPANDFVIVMALMSMVFVVGIWLNLRGLHASLISLAKHKQRDIMRIAHLNTVFLTSIEIRGNTFALRVRTCSLWLPFASIVVATVVGYMPVIYERFVQSDSYAGSNLSIFVFVVLSVVISLLHCWIAIECGKVMRHIDKIFSKDSV